jgi:hypothetical protein
MIGMVCVEGVEPNNIPSSNIIPIWMPGWAECNDVRFTGVTGSFYEDEISPFICGSSTESLSVQGCREKAKQGMQMTTC